MKQSIQPEINLTDRLLLAADQLDGKTQKKGEKKDLIRGKMAVNTPYQVTGQRGEEIVGNDEKRQMKTSQEQLFLGMRD